MHIQFSVRQQQILRGDAQVPATDSRKYLYTKWNFTRDWEGAHTRIMIVSREGMQPVKIILDAENIAEVPPAYIARSGEEDINLVFAIAGYGDNGLVITTAPINVTITPSYGLTAEAPADPPPDIVQQIFDEINKLRQYISERGVTFTPSVSPDGIISWTNDGGRDNPPPQNIKGQDGYIPVRGVDYWLPSDEAAIESARTAAKEANDSVGRVDAAINLISQKADSAIGEVNQAISDTSAAIVRADEATRKAETSSSAANTAAASALNAANTANSAAEKAGFTIERAHEATVAAQTAADRANSASAETLKAAEAATKSAARADASADTAKKAADKANAESQNAQTAANSANEKAALANAAAARADEAAIKATDAAENVFVFTPNVTSDGTISWVKDKGDVLPTPQNIKGPQGERGETGPRGEAGLRGETGAQGAQGERGLGVPAGGKAGQVLGKNTDADDDTAWTDVARIDDAAIGADAWSSRHTVDMLCPPLDASGNPVVCNPVAGYPLGVMASWEPWQEGEGEPSPDNVRPIVGRDAVSVTRCGKNMLDYAGTIVIPQANYSVKAPTELYNAILRLPRGVPLTMIAYWQGYSTNASTRQITLFGANGDKVNFINAIPIAIPKSMTITSVLIYAGMDKAQDCTVQDIQFFAGGEASQYKPYRGDTRTLALPRTVYGGEVDVVTGEGRETWKYKILDGAEQWSNYLDTSPSVKCFHSDVGVCSPLNQHDITMISNKFAWQYSNWSKLESWKISGSTKTSRVYLTVPVGIAATADEFKGYLAAQAAAGTPVTIAYKLATPQPFTATGGGALPALDGVNTVYTDADSVRVTGANATSTKIHDVQINGSSIVSDGTANIPIISDFNQTGLVRLSPSGGIKWSKNLNAASLDFAKETEIDARSSSSKPIIPYYLDYAVRTAMCDGKGAAWTPDEQAAARERLGQETINQELRVDDSTIGDRGWSSQHTVDMLCPEMTADSRSVQCHAFARTTVQAKVTWSPKQEGEGVPSPDNIRKIVVPANINFMVAGENLINGAKEYDTANRLLYVGVTEGNLAAAMLVPGQPYTIDLADPCEISMKINVIYMLDPQIKSVFDIRVGEEHITFVLPPEMPSGAYAIAFAAATGTEMPAIGSIVTLWRGREALPYKEYCGGKAVISTDDACGGTYDAVSGNVTADWAYAAFNGTEKWREVHDGKHIYFCPMPLRPASEEWRIVTGMCSHYQYYRSYYDSDYGTGIWTETINSETGYAVGEDVIEQCPSINDFRRYLMTQFKAGTPVQVAYKLAEPYKLAESYPMPMHARAEEMSVAADGDSMHVTWRSAIKPIWDDISANANDVQLAKEATEAAKNSAQDSAASALSSKQSVEASEQSINNMLQVIAKEPTAQEILTVMRQELTILKQLVDEGLSGGDLNGFSFALGSHGELIINYTNPQDKEDTATATFATNAQAQGIVQALQSTNETLRNMVTGNKNI